MTTAVTTPHLPDATGVDLQDWGALEAIGPAMQTRGRTLWDDADLKGRRSGSSSGRALMERSCTGSRCRTRTSSPAAHWAPSGETLACEGESESDPSRNGVYTVRVSDGQGLTRVTSNPGGIDAPVAYSPDGRLLLFARTPAGAGESSAKTALFVTPARGGKATRITPLGYTDDAAAWSPDGRSIVFETFGSLFRVRPDGTGLRKIAVTGHR